MRPEEGFSRPVNFAVGLIVLTASYTGTLWAIQFLFL